MYSFPTSHGLCLRGPKWGQATMRDDESSRAVALQRQEGHTCLQHGTVWQGSSSVFLSWPGVSLDRTDASITGSFCDCADTSSSEIKVYYELVTVWCSLVFSLPSLCTHRFHLAHGFCTKSYHSSCVISLAESNLHKQCSKQTGQSSWKTFSRASVLRDE